MQPINKRRLFPMCSCQLVNKRGCASPIRDMLAETCREVSSSETKREACTSQFSGWCFVQGPVPMSDRWIPGLSLSTSQFSGIFVGSCSDVVS